MSDKIMIFSDESTHLPNDGNDYLVLACVYMKEGTKNKLNSIINNYLKENKISGELKWTKVSNSNLKYYKEIISCVSKYNKSDEIKVRTLLALNKTKIYKSGSEHYNTMYYYLFKYIIEVHQDETYFHFLMDKKHKYFSRDVSSLIRYLDNTFHKKLTLLGSSENSSEHRMIQIADIIAGAMSYKKRNLKSSNAKLKLINHIESAFGITLNESSPISNKRFNTFIWRGKNHEPTNFK